jgi:UDP-sugar transporter A1/2/3
MKITTWDIREELRGLGLPLDGLKSELVARLAAATGSKEKLPKKRKATPSKKALASAKKTKRQLPAVQRQSTLYAHTRDVEDHGGVKLRPHHRTDDRYARRSSSRSPAPQPRRKRTLKRKDTPAPPTRSRRAAAKQTRSAMAVHAEEVDAAPKGAPSRRIGNHAVVASGAALGVLFMCIHAVQFAMQPLLTRWYQAESIPKPEIVLVCEVLKGALALAMLAASGKLAPALRSWTLSSSLRVAAVPAALYAVQNVLIQVGYAHLDALTFNIVNQSKIFFAATFVYVFVGATQTRAQTLALALVVLATYIVSQQHVPASAPAEDAAADASAALKFGLAPSIAAAAISGFTAALSQRVLQKSGRNSLLYSFELVSPASPLCAPLLRPTLSLSPADGRRAEGAARGRRGREREGARLKATLTLALTLRHARSLARSSLRALVSCILCTVTFHANHAHNLTRSP